MGLFGPLLLTFGALCVTIRSHPFNEEDGDIPFGKYAMTPRPQFDRTADLIGRTIYIEYLASGYRGYWVAPEEDYDGMIFAVIEEEIYNPDNGVRIDIRDCLDGYACLRTRYREDEHFVEEKQAENNVNISNKTIASRGTYFLESNLVDVDFVSSTAPEQNSRLKWQIFCDSATDLDHCFICDYYYSHDYPNEFWSCLYSSNKEHLHTDWSSEHDSSWFYWRIVAPSAEDDGFQEADLSVCNNGGTTVNAKLTLCTGVTITDTASWHFSESISQEIHEGIEIDIVSVGDSISHSAEWGVEMTHSETFSEEKCVEISYEVPQGQEIAIIQLQGSYGPYTVKGSSKYEVVHREC